MTLKELKSMVESRIAFLTEQRNFAQQSGDMETYNRMDAEIIETQTTLKELNS